MENTIQQAFGGAEQLALSFILAVMIFGLALDIRPSDFKRIIKDPRAPIAGLIAQFLLLPAATWCLTMLLDLPAAIELGMILVAACPGGAISNFITLLARANVALSLSMTAASSLAAIILLPINFAFWAGLNPDTAALLQTIDIDAAAIFEMLLYVLAIPLLLGQVFRHSWPAIAAKLYGYLKPLSVIVLFSFIAIAVTKNFDDFARHFWYFFTIVLGHNLLAFGLGWAAAAFSRLKDADSRAVVIEVGIQNSSLALTIIATKFGGLPDMMLIAAFWGTWHIGAGFIFAALSSFVLKRRTITDSQARP